MKLHKNIKRSAATENALREAAAALEAGRAQECEGIARSLIGNRDRDAAALQLLGMALLAQNRASEAVPPLEEAARIRPGAAVETYLATAFKRTARAAEALTLLQ